MPMVIQHHHKLKLKIVAKKNDAKTWIGKNGVLVMLNVTHLGES